MTCCWPGTGAEELQARLRLAITRRRSAVDGTLKFGDLVLHPASFTASLDGADPGLTLTEFKLLNFLVQHAGQAFTRTRLMHEAWGYDSTGKVRTVDVHMRRLRAKLGTRHQFDGRHRPRCRLPRGNAAATANGSSTRR